MTEREFADHLLSVKNMQENIRRSSHENHVCQTQLRRFKNLHFKYIDVSVLSEKSILIRWEKEVEKAFGIK